MAISDANSPIYSLNTIISHIRFFHHLEEWSNLNWWILNSTLKELSKMGSHAKIGWVQPEIYEGKPGLPLLNTQIILWFNDFFYQKFMPIVSKPESTRHRRNEALTQYSEVFFLGNFKENSGKHCKYQPLHGHYFWGTFCTYFGY
jgi:hypothetical protein